MTTRELPSVAPQTVGIIGYGRFGRVLAAGLREDFASSGALRIYDPLADFTNSPEPASTLAQAAASDAVFVCVPVLAFERTVAEVVPHLRTGATLLDVCSVKLYPERVMREQVLKRFAGERFAGVDGVHAANANAPQANPSSSTSTSADATVHILPTHPMFGPDTAKNGWAGLPMALCPTDSTHPAYKAQSGFWRDYFAEKKGCVVTELSSEEHDRITAYTLCLTQLLGRVLGNIGITSSPIDAQSFTHLLRMKEISYNDSMELLVGLHRYNPFAKEMRERLRAEFDAVEPFLGVDE
jgi:prephenate dehydrogenase